MLFLMYKDHGLSLSLMEEPCNPVLLGLGMDKLRMYKLLRLLCWKEQRLILKLS